MPILFTDNSNMFIDHTCGSIGIGTTNSTSNLHVIGSTLLNGNLVVSGFTSISNVSFSSSISLTGLTVTGTGITGILNTASQPNITSVGTLTGLSVSGTGITGTLNTVSQTNITSLGTLTGLSVTGTGITGTLNTATQTNITSVGTLTGLSVAGTGITGTLNTATQTNITSVGTLTGLSVAGTGITGTLNTATQNNITSVGTLTGLSVAGTGITGTLNTATQNNITSVGTLTGLSVAGTGITGTLNTATQNNITSVGTLTSLTVGPGLTGMYITTIGNIGIGTATPVANLHILGHTRLLNNFNNTGLYVNHIGNVGIGTSLPGANLHVLGYSQFLNTAGTLGLTVASTGNVGIATTNPQYHLDVNGTLRCSNVAVFQGGATTFNTFGATLGMDGNNCCLQLNANANVASGSYIDFSNVGNDYWGRILYDSTHFMAFHTRGNERMRIDASGNLGLGTGTPLGNLHIFTGLTTIPASGNIAANIGGPLTILHGSNDGFNRFISALDTNMTNGSNRSVVFGQASSTNNQAELGYFHIGNGSNNNYMGMGLYNKTILYLAGTSNVGIGSTSPTNKLDVTGGISSSLFNNFSISTPMATGSTSTTNIMTFPSSGVYFLLVSNNSSSSSSTTSITDNLCHVYLAIVSTGSGYPVQLTGIYKPNTIYLNVTSTSQFTVNLVINSGSFTYSFYYQKIF